MFKLNVTKLVLVTLSFLLVIPIAASISLTSASAFTAANLNRFSRVENYIDQTQNQLFVEFQYKMFFNDVDRETLFDFIKDIEKDDLWCLCSTTEVTFDGFGRRDFLRTWEQTYTFAGIVDEITYRRLFLRNDKQHSWRGDGQFANIVADQLLSDLDNGGTLLTFNAIYKPNVPATEEQVAGILELLRLDYETKFIPYFENITGEPSTGTVDLTFESFII